MTLWDNRFMRLAKVLGLVTRIPRSGEDTRLNLRLNTDKPYSFTMASAYVWCAVISTIAHASADTATWAGCHKVPKRVIHPGTLDNEATILSLQKCNISKIESTDLVLPNLETLILSTNNIESVNADLFKSVPKLRAVFLGENRIRGKDIPSTVFHDCRSLQRIGFTGNNMTGTPVKLLENLDELHTLWLDNCSLQELPLFAAQPSLLNLYVYNNQIKALDNPDVFISLGNLQRLHLYNNLIDLIHENTFRYLTNIVSIHLNRNNIRYLPDYLFTNVISLKTLNLENNRIEYISRNLVSGCKNLALINLSVNRLTFLPENIIARLGSLSQFYFDRNPLQCGCLNEILIEVKEKTVKYRSEYYNGSVPVCVSIDFRCHRLKDVYREIYEAATQDRS